MYGKKEKYKDAFFFSSTDYRYEISIKYQLGYFLTCQKNTELHLIKEEIY